CGIERAAPLGVTWQRRSQVSLQDRRAPNACSEFLETVLRPYGVHFFIRGEFPARCRFLRQGDCGALLCSQDNWRLFRSCKLQHQPRDLILRVRRKTAGGFYGAVKQSCHKGKIRSLDWRRKQNQDARPLDTLRSPRDLVSKACTNHKPSC